MSRSAAERPARLVDVARASGVAVSTVSRVLNREETLNLRPETRQRILDAASQVGYRPNRLARALRTKTTGAVGVVVPSLRNPVWAEVVRGVLAEAEKRDYIVVLTEIPDGCVEVEQVELLVQQGRVDGLLLASAIEGPPGTPHVYLNRGREGSPRNVVMDEHRSVALALEHLTALGHRSIALLDGPTDIDTVRRRAEAARLLAHDLGIDVALHSAAFTEADAYAEMRRIVETEHAPTACVVASLNQIIGALAAVRHAGIDIPGELSIVTLDEDELLAYLEVPVTAVRMPLARMGGVAFTALMEQIEGVVPSGTQVEGPMDLVVRSSTGPLRHTRPSGTSPKPRASRTSPAKGKR